MSNAELSDLQRFQISVADALSRWQIVEINLQKFFVAVIAAPDERWAAAAYNAVLALKAKVDMLHEILKWRLPPKDVNTGIDLLAEWIRLKDRVLDQSRQRNYLVHWTFIATYTPENRDSYTYIAAPFADARKHQTGRQLDETKLNQMAREFAVLQVEISQFHQKVLPVLASPEKFQ